MAARPIVVAIVCTRTDIGEPFIFSSSRNKACPPSSTGIGRKFTMARFTPIIAMK
jgi:hypothetical protein